MDLCSMTRSPVLPVVLALFLQPFSRLGLVKAMGILFPHISESISWNSVDLGVAIGLFYAVGLFSAPIVAFVLTHRVIHPRLLLVFGASAGSFAIVLAAVATCKIHFFVLFAISGTGYYTMRVICVTALDRLAGENFNLLYSLATCGNSVGMVVLPLLAEELLNAYDWRGVFLILGGTLLHIIPCGTAIRITKEDLAPRDSRVLQRRYSLDNSSLSALDETTDNDPDDSVKGTSEEPLLTPPKGHGMTGSDKNSLNNVFNNSNRINNLTSIRGKMSSCLESTAFYADPFSLFIVFSNAIFGFVYNGWHAFLVPQALQRGFSPRSTIIITFVAGLGNLLIRLIIGSLTHKLIDPINMHLCLTVLNIFSMACDGFLANFYLMLVTSLCSAAAIAGRAVLGILVMRNRVSSENLPMVLSVIYVTEGFGYVLGGYLSAPIVASVITRVTRPRLLFVFGATAGSSAITLAPFATNKTHFFVLFALSGIGYMTLHLICVTALDRLAGENFNLLYSFTTCGSAVGMVVLPLLTEELLKTYDWRGVLLILGGTFLHIIPCAVAIRITKEDLTPKEDKVQQRRYSLKDSSPYRQEEATDRDRDDLVKDTHKEPLMTPSIEYNSTASDNTPLDHSNLTHNLTSFQGKVSSWFKSTTFYADPLSLFIVLSNATLSVVYNGWHTFLVPQALQRGFSPRSTIIITFVAGLGNLLIRLTVGSLTHKVIDPMNMHLYLTVLNIFSLACDGFLPNFYVMLVTSFCSAAAIAGRAALGILVMRNRVSAENLPMALSLIYVTEGFGYLLGGYLSGLIADTFSSYDASFKLLAVVDILTFVFMLIPKLVKKPNLPSESRN